MTKKFIAMQQIELIVFGTSNIVSDIVECAIACGIMPKKVILDLPESSGSRDIPISKRIEILNQHWNIDITIEPLEDFAPKDNQVYLLGPTTPQRENLVGRINSNYQIHFHNLIHPSAYVSPLAKIGQGLFIGAKSVLGPGVTIGDHVFINRGVTIGHDTKVGSYSRIQPGTNIGGLTEIGRSVSVGIGSTIVDRVVIGHHAVIGAGSCVLGDIASHQLAAGCPATIKRTL